MLGRYLHFHAGPMQWHQQLRQINIPLLPQMVCAIWGSLRRGRSPGGHCRGWRRPRCRRNSCSIDSWQSDRRRRCGTDWPSSICRHCSECRPGHCTGGGSMESTSSTLALSGPFILGGAGIAGILFGTRRLMRIWHSLDSRRRLMRICFRRRLQGTRLRSRGGRSQTSNGKVHRSA